MALNSRTAGVALGALLSVLWLGVVVARGPTPPPQQSVQADTCLTCHDKAAETRLHEYHRDCQTCHTGAGAHVEAPEKGNISRPAATECLTCHGATMSGKWSFGQHAKAQVACANCHTMHASRTATGVETRARRIDAVSSACASCHTEAMARFRLPSHHPVTEGVMSCTNCHDPHSGERTSVRAEADRCGSCHPAQRTPKAIVHPPVAEGCSTCHAAHGSANRRLLAVAQPSLCIQCHSVADNRHAVGSTARGALGGAVLRNCVGCHKAIHGSQTDPHLRF